MKQVLIQQGKAVVEEVPPPQVEAGCVVVRTHFSCISPGTEMSGIRESATPLWKRAVNQPEKILTLLETASMRGIGAVYQLVQERLAQFHTIGYSAAGVITAVGAGITDLAPGQRVACSGAGYAHHAEVIRVPRNLVARVPDNLELDVASSVALGAIALQGVRRCAPGVGETIAVIGLGVLGQLTVQLLKAGGCRTVGIDPDAKRMELARGLDLALPPGEEGFTAALRFTHGYGVDGAIICAATPSDEVTATAFRLCRKRGRVVLVGDVGLNLNRADIYKKELDFLVSTSCGPGRYDRSYEEEGLDYPISHVRWTEQRNMEEYLRLLASGAVELDHLYPATYPVTQAATAYDQLQDPANRPLMVWLSYPEAERAASNLIWIATTPPRTTGRVAQVAVIGAGNLAKGVHLPNLKRLNQLFHLRAVMSRSGPNALATARQFGADYATTDYGEILADPGITALVIATRHHLHASLTLAALHAGKHVLVEKPLVLSSAELAPIAAFYRDWNRPEPPPVLLTGFNRRFSRHVEQIRNAIAQRVNPLVINYVMNAGHLPGDHWVNGPEGGGRNLGEACHVYDLFTALVGVYCTEVMALPFSSTLTDSRDNFSVLLRFKDGSLANLVYTALGNSEYPSEELLVFCDGHTYHLRDYRQLTITGAARGVPGLTTPNPEKGQLEELEAFGRALLQGKEWPSPLWQQLQAAEIALRVEKML